MKMHGLALFALIALASPAVLAEETVPLISAEHAAKIREEIRLQENRARELDPILARDRQARHDVETNWVVLERHARELHARAKEFRTIGDIVGGKAKADLNGFAQELDTFATHDEENAHFQHEMAERLDKAIAGEAAAREWHLKHAARLREWLSANGV